MVFIYCVLSFFSDAADNEHSYLVEIPVERSIFECNIQKSVPRLLQLKNIMLSSRIEICSWDLKLQWQMSEISYPTDVICQMSEISYERQVTRVKLRIFTRFALKLVFRVSGRSVPWDKPPTSKWTGVENLHVIFKCCL